ncbi:MBOAT family protein [Rhizobium sp. CECT 9324]|uniref:MBOAT family O-acyltransferase n=1 Tax=Rhizobium sp. CECT 9324 TaxID=2845820 RepID=UPI001E538C2E|nr:MBOAT family protein [Rhizobium sp. CECT 9324]
MIQRGQPRYARAWLVLASLFFYSYWNVAYLPLIVVSILFNFYVGGSLAKTGSTPPMSAEPLRRWLLAFGIATNLCLLGYFKYTDFLLQNINAISGADFALQNIALPLAISFFSFTQIIYLVDSYRGETGHYGLLNYSLFVTFFPHLIAGPLVQHGHIMPQFEDAAGFRPRSENIARGLVIFSIGLFKKVVIADSLAPLATSGFDSQYPLNFYEAWTTSLSYTFQLYFDFSGYCDMAIGASLLFNIVLPINFNSPYKATSIQEFWRRWHITLSSFLRDFIYIPLGGGRKSHPRTYLNLIVTFLLGGLWHGPTWMFVVWGALHGIALVLHRAWTALGLRMPQALAWITTFMFINVSWVFFRAHSFEDAVRVLQGMVDFETAFSGSWEQIKTSELSWAGTLASKLAAHLPITLIGQLPAIPLLAVAFCLIPLKNSTQIAADSWRTSHAVYAALIFSIAMYFSLAQTETVFLYFTF